MVAQATKKAPFALKVNAVSKTFDDGLGTVVKALDGVSFSMEKPEIVGLVGPSGCGKSTLLRMVAGLEFPTEGSLEFGGQPIKGPHYQRGLVFQDAALYDWLTVRGNIEFGLRARKVLETEGHKVDQYIKLMGLEGFENSYPYQISGGMASRTALARTFVQDPALVLLDEPLSALDAFTRAMIQDQIVERHLASDALFLLVTHDIEEAVYLCDRVLIMSARPGKLVGEVAIGLPHPRNRLTTEFMEKRKEILDFFTLCDIEGVGAT